MDILKKISRITRFDSGGVVKEKEACNTDMYIVIDGVLSLSIYDQRTHTRVAQMNIGRGAFFGGLGLIVNANRYISVDAVENSVVMYIPYKQVEEYRRYLRNEGEIFYQSLIVKAEKFGEMIRGVELEFIKKMYKPNMELEHYFYRDEDLDLRTLDILSSNYILKRKLKCPVCMKEFEVDTVRTSRLLLRKKGDLFVNEYKDVEPLWFDIVVCPSCYYSERISDFEKDIPVDLDVMYKTLLDIKSSIMFSYSKNRTASEVVNAYMIYDKCIETKDVHAKDKAKSAILIAEVFRRVGHVDEAEKYYQKAFEYYDNMIGKGVLDVDDFQMQQLYILFGKLYERKGLKNEAIAQYKNAKMMHHVHDKRYTNIADSYLYNLTYN